MSATVLVTGFEPFAGQDVNESWQAVQLMVENHEKSLLSGSDDSSVNIITQLLPVTFNGAFPALKAALEGAGPVDLILATGLDMGGTAVKVEQVAQNLTNARVPDNAGVQPMGQPVITGGQETLAATVPVARIAAALRRAGLPTEISSSAGAFVCNAVFYQLMEFAGHTGIPAGFIHVPPANALAVVESARALEVVIAEILFGA